MFTCFLKEHVDFLITLCILSNDQVYSNTRVPTQVNANQNESTRINTSPIRVNTNHYESDTSQHKSKLVQHESNTSQHESVYSLKLS